MTTFFFQPISANNGGNGTFLNSAPDGFSFEFFISAPNGCRIASGEYSLSIHIETSHKPQITRRKALNTREFFLKLFRQNFYDIFAPTPFLLLACDFLANFPVKLNEFSIDTAHCFVLPTVDKLLNLFDKRAIFHKSLFHQFTPPDSCDMPSSQQIIFNISSKGIELPPHVGL